MLSTQLKSVLFKHTDNENIQAPLTVEFENKNLKISSKNSQEFSKNLKQLIQFIWHDENAINNLNCSIQSNHTERFIWIKDVAIYEHNEALLNAYEILINKLFAAKLIDKTNALQSKNKINSAKTATNSSNKSLIIS